MSDSETEEPLVNKVVVERYLKNNKDYDKDMLKHILGDDKDKKNNNLNIYVNDKDPKPNLSRRSTSVQRNKKNTNLITSFREMDILGYKKQVTIHDIMLYLATNLIFLKHSLKN